MKVTEIKGNLLNINVDAICHQVNCIGKMGAGLALQIRNRHPKAYEKYVMICNRYESAPEKLLGKVQYVPSGGKLVINIFGQAGIRRDKYDRKVYTNYDALNTAIDKIARDIQCSNIKSIGFPVGMGSNLAGGDWNTVKRIILEGLNDTDLDVIFVEYAQIKEESECIEKCYKNKES